MLQQLRARLAGRRPVARSHPRTSVRTEEAAAVLFAARTASAVGRCR